MFDQNSQYRADQEPEVQASFFVSASRCASCPDDRRIACRAQSCHRALADLRVAAYVGPDCDAMPAVVGQDTGSQLGGERIDRQLTRLDVENGDILVLRTRFRLKPEVAAKWQEELQLLCRSQGVRDASVIVLDDCTDLTIERPHRPDTRMQHQGRAIAPQPTQGQ